MIYLLSLRNRNLNCWNNLSVIEISPVILFHFHQQKKGIEKTFLSWTLQASLVAALSSFLGRHMFILVDFVLSVRVSRGLGWVLSVLDLYHFKNSRQVNSMHWNQSHLEDQQLSKFLLGIIEQDWLYENESRKPHSKWSWEAMKGEALIHCHLWQLT